MLLNQLNIVLKTSMCIYYNLFAKIKTFDENPLLFGSYLIKNVSKVVLQPKVRIFVTSKRYHSWVVTGGDVPFIVLINAYTLRKNGRLENAQE